MSTKETPFAISAVTHLTGISPHTLRKWESRYSVVQPKRTPSGRRVYTQSDVDKLALLKALVAQGHPISVLSSLSDAELQALQHQLPEIKESGPADQIIVVGHMLTATLKREPLQHDNVELLATDARQWLADGGPRGEPGSRALVVELSTVEATDANQLATAASEFDQVILVYGFTTQATLAQLSDKGILCLKAPADARQLASNLLFRANPPAVLDVLNDPRIPRKQYDEQAIAALAAISPKIACECPAHIAALLSDINAFEQYSLNCEDSAPGDRALHARLRLIAANARALFEQAVAEVAQAEGMDPERLKV
tara:strand:- start:3736 stop:4674 length:939 start_codon:yes stop_codon:yes gene_type:complete